MVKFINLFAPLFRPLKVVHYNIQKEGSIPHQFRNTFVNFLKETTKLTSKAPSLRVRTSKQIDTSEKTSEKHCFHQKFCYIWFVYIKLKERSGTHPAGTQVFLKPIISGFSLPPNAELPRARSTDFIFNRDQQISGIFSVKHFEELF